MEIHLNTRISRSIYELLGLFSFLSAISMMISPRKLNYIIISVKGSRNFKWDENENEEQRKKKHEKRKYANNLSATLWRFVNFELCVAAVLLCTCQIGYNSNDIKMNFSPKKKMFYAMFELICFGFIRQHWKSFFVGQIHRPTAWRIRQFLRVFPSTIDWKMHTSNFATMNDWCVRLFFQFSFANGDASIFIVADSIKLNS